MQKHKIFVIDDDLDIQELILNYFRPRGYIMKGFERAEDALWELENDPEGCDVLITDLLLPKMSGFDLIKTMKDKGLNIPIILMTAHKSSESAIEAIQAGAYDFVVKPIHFPQLLVSVERAIYLNRIHEENTTLRQAVTAKEGSAIDGIIGKSQAFLKVVDLAKRVADSSANVFISGESGTGKEVISRAIHQFSNRKKGPFIAINCSAIPENLLESELFGYVKGAFTGAADKKLGLFEEAEGGTLFLDEIGDLSLSLQAKLLRVLQERKIKRLGENQARKVNVRIICATHKNLKKEVQEKTFREDLYFRVAVIPIHIPPLRDRREDIIPLAEFFLKKYAALNSAAITSFTKEAIEFLLKSNWQGNVRELENSIERAVVMRSSGIIDVDDLNLECLGEFSAEAVSTNTVSGASGAVGAEEKRFYGDVFDPSRPLMSLHELTEQYILHALKQYGGAKDKTAKVLGIDRKTLYRKIQDFESRGISLAN